MNYTKTDAFLKLKKHHELLTDQRTADLFAAEADRMDKLVLTLDDFIIDFSKNKIDKRALELLCRMAEEVDIKKGVQDMLNGRKINSTEKRAVLHTALRNLDKDFHVDGVNISLGIRDTLNAMCKLAEGVRNGMTTGYTGKRIMDVVNIGIGGSYLGPKMAIRALDKFKTPLINFHFIANVDPVSAERVLKRLDAETTLFIVNSKSWTTDETLTNAAVCREWLVERLGVEAVGAHFVAASSNVPAANDFGLLSANVFGFGDYVGGRYSMWGPVGLPLLIAIGEKNFLELLAGAAVVDRHFADTPFEKNLPVVMALVDLWNIEFLNIGDLAVLPYSTELALLPAYLQQLVMESLGKSVGADGEPIDFATSPLLFGQEGTCGQHSFYQMLHQGSKKIACDFIAPVISSTGDTRSQRKLLANMVAQAEALMIGQKPAETEPNAAFRTFVGDRPSNTILMRKLTPKTLGMLIALYEHRTYATALLMGINAFDQFGVELGKKLAMGIEKELAGTVGAHDPSTTLLINTIKEFIQ
ncbi:MAG: glucose-6-phosphate isomerase [Alphaproteobacteria bacterium]|nr:glucose-6-phosphate isomerase [Alphaproteobacteria bacterium]